MRSIVYVSLFVARWFAAIGTFDAHYYSVCLPTIYQQADVGAFVHLYHPKSGRHGGVMIFFNNKNKFYLHDCKIVTMLQKRASN